MRAAIAAPVIVAWLLLWPSPARALDPFEIQVYDGTANAPGKPGIELHLNRVMNGVATPNGPELAPNHQTHMTLEPSIGVRPWWELGAYLQMAARGDGTFDYAGTKLRSKFVTPPAWDRHWRLGVNLELSLLPEKYDRDRWATEVRPIAAWADERWLFAINPIIGVPLAGDGYSKGPTFEPAAMVIRDNAGKVGVGLEYYTSFGAIAGVAPWGEQQHYLFEVANLVAIKNFELNVGVGEGLTDASNPLVFKTILGYVFE